MNFNGKGPRPLELDKVKSLQVRSWLWIDILKEHRPRSPVSGYFRVQEDYTKGDALCAGYPGITYEFEYADYGRTWVGFQFQPGAMEEL